MAEMACHAVTVPPRERAKAALQRLGVANVAEWCAVGRETPYQWLRRGDDAHPIPPEYVPLIIEGARAAGKPFDPTDVWPASIAFQPLAADEDHARPRDFLAVADPA